MRKTYYDFKTDVLGMVFTALFAGIAVLLMFFSVDVKEGFVFALSSSKHGFLFTPAGLLIVISCIALLVMALESIKNQERTPYLLLPISVMGILFALRAILIEGDISLFLELRGLDLGIALIRGLLGISVLVMLFLLVTNVVPDKKYLLIVLSACIGWHFGTECFLFSNSGSGLHYLYDSSQAPILLSQIAYYFTVMFFSFSIKPRHQEKGIMASNIGNNV